MLHHDQTDDRGLMNGGVPLTLHIPRVCVNLKRAGLKHH